MNRREVYTPELPRTYDFLKGWRDAFKGVGFAAGDLFGSVVSGNPATAGYVGTNLIAAASLFLLNDHGGLTVANDTPQNCVVSGFAPGVSSMHLNIDVGSIYLPMVVDDVGNLLPVESGTPTNYADLGNDPTSVIGQCICGPAQFSLVAPGSGCNWYAVYVTPLVQDTTESDDPNLQSPNSNAVLPYYNSAQPTVPYAGPAGAGTQQSTVRQATGAVAITAAIPGTSTTPGNTTGITPVPLPTGAVPLYYVQVITGDTSISYNRIWAVGRGSAGPNASTPPFTGSPVAPFLTGLLGQHHLGLPGTGPKIDGGVEWEPLSAVNNNAQSFYNVNRLGMNGSVETISGVATSGNWGVNTTVASGTATGITTGTTLCTFTPTFSGIYRIDIQVISPDGGSNYPFADIQFKDGLGNVTGFTASIPMILMSPAAAGGRYYWYMSLPLYCESGTAITVGVEQHSSETLSFAAAAITAVS